MSVAWRWQSADGPLTWRRQSMAVILRRGGERLRVDREGSTRRLTFVADDPSRSPFRSLLVLNEDLVAPGRGFGLHPHRDAEILFYVVEGVNEHRDDAGHTVVLRAGDVQRLTAGSGQPVPVVHVLLFDLG